MPKANRTHFLQAHQDALYPGTRGSEKVRRPIIVEHLEEGGWYRALFRRIPLEVVRDDGATERYHPPLEHSESALKTFTQRTAADAEIPRWYNYTNADEAWHVFYVWFRPDLRHSLRPCYPIPSSRILYLIWNYCPWWRAPWNFVVVLTWIAQKFLQERSEYRAECRRL